MIYKLAELEAAADLLETHPDQAFALYERIGNETAIVVDNFLTALNAMSGPELFEAVTEFATDAAIVGKLFQAGSAIVRNATIRNISPSEYLAELSRETGAPIPQSARELVDLVERCPNEFGITSGVARVEQAAATGITASRSYVDVETAIRIVDKFKENPAALTAEEIRILINTDVNAERFNSLEQTVARLSETTQDIRYDIVKSRNVSTAEYFKFEERARRLYENFRSIEWDIKRIAENTGIPEEIVAQVKDHIFYARHNLMIGQGLLFDPDIDIALAWQRLVDGELVRSDLHLLLHEYSESIILQRSVLTNGEEMQAHIAHMIANQIYNWQDFA